MKPYRPKRTSLLRRICLFACLALIACGAIAMPGTVAKYRSSGSATAQAKVAVAIAEATGTGDAKGTIDVVKNKTYTYTVTVSNLRNEQVSEVDMGYEIYIDLPSGFPPMEFTVSDTEEHSQQIDTSTTEATRLTFHSNKTLKGGTETENVHTVTVAGTEQTLGTHLNLNVEIKVKAEQID